MIKDTSGLLPSPLPPNASRTRQFVSHTTIGSLVQQGASAIQALAQQHGHRLPVRVIEGQAADVVRAQKEQAPVKASNPVSRNETRAFGRGSQVVHGPSRQKVVITTLNVGQGRNGEKMHKVTTRDGRKFVVSESNLQIL